MAVFLLLLLAWPTTDSDSELRLAMAFALAPFPLSMVAAWVARLPYWPAVGLVAPFAMLAVGVIQPEYDSWVSNETLAFCMLMAGPVVVGFMFTVLVCELLFGKIARPTGGDTA
ncbi:hypothetical protein ABZ897_20835 [Nonomuraea sp. NPDC046802]|uniref:hypothetical protein n=1 Tax=Nonomuraea sp. NPDC046802 TaxID=3154919 RepID=UPI0033EA0008